MGSKVGDDEEEKGTSSVEARNEGADSFLRSFFQTWMLLLELSREELSLMLSPSMARFRRNQSNSKSRRFSP